MQNNIILIGFMGVGKGTTARVYSKRYGMYNIDTDDLIESKTKKRVKKIFAKKGEKEFRKLEQQTADWIESSVRGTLISCGGGFYTVNNINSLGKVVLLDASFEWIHHRLSSAKNAENKLAKRPLFATPKKAKELYNTRVDRYRDIADIIVSVEGKSMDEICLEIYEACGV